MGAVNIFLGGTGKFIAEDIQDSRDFYGLSIGDPVAFDLNATIKAGVKLPGFVSADKQTIDGVARLADEWVNRDPGRGLAPAPDSSQPGPRIAPEEMPLTSIGAGIRSNAAAPTDGLFALRAHGLAVFSMLFDARQARAGAGPGNALRQQIAAGVRAETRDGVPPRINIVTSTAGGTGAGMVIPLALWLRKEYRESPLNLLAVTASAFEDTLRDNPELRAKGLSGTYALLRELSFLRGVDPTTRFSERKLPVTRDNLMYRPGGELFDRIYWFGGRTGAQSTAAFHEAEPLLRALSWDTTASDLGAETGGTRPDRWVGAITAIEYPKLRLQRSMVFKVLEDAYRSLQEPVARYAGERAAGDRISLLDYVNADTTRPLGAWFYKKRLGAMAQQEGQPTRDDANDLIEAVQGATELGDYRRINRGTDINSDNYDSSTVGWGSYTGQVVRNLRDRDGGNQDSLRNTVGAMRREEEAAFGAWLRQKVYGEWLSAPKGGSGEPRATGEVLEMLDVLERDVGEFASRFRNPELFVGNTLDEADTEVRQREEKFEKPDYQAAEQAAKTTPRDGLISLGVATVVGVLGAIVARPIADAIPEFAGGLSQYLPWVAVVVLAILTRWIVLDRRLHDRLEAAKPKNVRRDCEDALISAYAARDRVRALRWLQQELRGERDGRAEQVAEPFFEVLRQRIRAARVEVQRLADIYKALQGRAAAQVSESGMRPPHVREEVGDCISDDPGMIERIRPQVRRRIAVEPAAAGLRLLLTHTDAGDRDNFSDAGEDATDLRLALEAESEAGFADAGRALERWEKAAKELVDWQLGEHLPADFHTAMLRCDSNNAAMAVRTLASKLANLDLPKTPSVTLVSDDGAPAYRRLYAGSDEILARLNVAVGNLSGAQQGVIEEYWRNRYVVRSLGEQIVFLDLWADPGGRSWAPAPHVIGNAVEVAEDGGAMQTYYGVTPGVETSWTAVDTTFTVIPELLAATKIELGTGTVDPLAPAVVARLLGCDLDMAGPTYAELFYLLRHRGLLRTVDRGVGPEARTVTVIGDGDDDDAMSLVSRPVGSVPDAASGDGRPAFGAGRAAVIDFDTFVEFMRHEGQTMMAGQGPGFSPFPNAEPHVRDWAAAPARVAELQRMAVEEWYAGDVEDDAAAMLAVLAEDVAAMANGEAAVRSSWERAMRRLLAGDERKAIRRTHLSAGAGGGAAEEPPRPFGATGA